MRNHILTFPLSLRLAGMGWVMRQGIFDRELLESPSGQTWLITKRPGRFIAEPVRSSDKRNAANDK